MIRYQKLSYKCQLKFHLEVFPCTFKFERMLRVKAVLTDFFCGIRI